MRGNKVYFVAWRFFGYGNLIRMNYKINPDFGHYFFYFSEYDILFNKTKKWW